MKAMAIIPARAGSVGVPQKNFRELLGKMVINYTIEAALQAELVDRIVVTTDYLEMRSVCRGFGIDMVERPADLADGVSRMDDTLRHCCEAIEAKDGYRPDVVVMLYANVPVRAEGIIDKAIHKLLDTGCDSVQTVETVGRHHPYWMQKLDGDKMSKFIDNQVDRRQDLPDVYALNGGLGVVRYDCLFAAAGNSDPHAFWGQDKRAIVQQEHETVDIDASYDFFLAEAILREKRGEVLS
ncbi:MAG: acylneuraminate cytidylyltransferase family protein [Sedimentisphaerales bacterium]|nr:acylneuraminate cytidylyltransferase family protein [Sedimentisphaerales bacterium]